ncbi:MULTISPECIES: ribosome-inactivating family protein [unclassified Streptomyces]|uniref:ribosome-inactivating family protein n=1 Tax=unclassified Streptomyces TaxID=2593676 RepID=UPI0033AAC47F
MRKEIPALLLAAALLTGAAPAAQAADAHPHTAATAVAVRPQVVLNPVFWDFQSSDASVIRNTYGQAISRLRQSAGHAYAADTSFQVTSDQADIATMTVLLPGNRRVSLHYTTDNLYLRGFSVGQGDVVQFNDFDLGHEMDRNARTLPFNGRYGTEHGHLEANSSRTRAQISFSRRALSESLENLYNFANESGNVNNQQVATAALTLVAATSEGARFQPVYQDVLNAIPGEGGASQSGDDLILENNWSSLTAFTRRLANHENPAELVLGNRRFRTIQNVRNVLVMLLSSSSRP